MAISNKYDRQLRLWGQNGQKRLNESRICLLTCSGLGTEVLKNLVLPGVGFVTLIDEKEVTERDLGNNFFLTKEDLGQPRAQATKKWLLELNPDVQGESIQSSPSQLIKQNPEFFRSFDLVIASQLTLAESAALEPFCSKLLVVKSIGLLGYLRVSGGVHLVVEGKPADKELYDLRIHRPFSELQEFVDSIDLDSLDEKAHGHIPFVVVLVKAIQEYIKEFGGPPSSFEQKDQFKQRIKNKSRNFFAEQNFVEAYDRAYLSYASEILPFEVSEILEDQNTQNANSESDVFWIAAKGVSRFIQEEGVPPLTGLFPDMTAESTCYLSLQRVYNQKAKKDLDKVLTFCEEIKNLTPEDKEFISVFCRNLLTIERTNYKHLTEELKQVDSEELMSQLYEENPLVEWYFGLRAYEKFTETNGRCPGVNSEYLKEDSFQVFNTAKELITQNGIEGCEFREEVAQELVRYGNSEIHTVCSMLGGVAAQEAVKLITKQYSPLNNTFIFCGVDTTAQVIQP